MSNIIDVLIKVKSKLLSNYFFKNVFILLSWTLLSQVVTLVASPILSRLYTPEEYGEFANFISIISILGMLSTGKFEAAIMIPKEDKISVSLAYLVIIISTIFSAFLLILFLLFEYYGVSFLELDIKIILLIPLYLLVYGFWQTTNNLGNRLQVYWSIGISKLIQSLIVVVVAIAFGYYLSNGLVYSIIFGLIISSLYLFHIVRRKYDYHKINYKQLIEVFIKYSNFFKYSTISGLFNSFSNVSFPILISIFFNPIYTGLYFFSNKIMRIPLNYLFSSLSQVYYQEAIQLYNNSPNDLYIFTLNIQRKIFTIIFPVLLLMSIFSPYIFSLIFGEEWVNAGEYVKYYSIFLLFNGLYSPISSLMDILKKQRFLLFFNVSLGLSQILIIWVSSFFFSFEFSLLITSIFGALHFVGINIYIYKLLKNY